MADRITVIIERLQRNLLPEEEGLRWWRDLKPRLLEQQAALKELLPLAQRMKDSRLINLGRNALTLIENTLRAYELPSLNDYFSEHTTRELNDSIRKVLEALGMTRRSFLGLFSKAATVAGAAMLLPKSLFAIDGAYFVRFWRGTVAIEAQAMAERIGIPAESLRIHKDPRGGVHLLYNHRFAKAKSAQNVAASIGKENDIVFIFPTGEVEGFGEGMASGFYLQFGALRTGREANELIGKLQLEDLKTHRAEDEYPFKVLLDRRCATLEEARLVIRQLSGSLAHQAVGIIEILPDGRTEWRKTVEQEIMEKAREIAASPQAQAERSRKPYHRFIVDAVRRYRLDKLKRTSEKEAIFDIHAFIDIESRGNPRAKGPTGDYGLMQVVHTERGWSTWRAFHLNPQYSRCFHGGEMRIHTCDIFDPEQNIDCGVCYLAYLLHRNYPEWPWEFILRMYNAGEEKVKKGMVKNDIYVERWKEARKAYE